MVLLTACGGKHVQVQVNPSSPEPEMAKVIIYSTDILGNYSHLFLDEVDFGEIGAIPMEISIKPGVHVLWVDELTVIRRPFTLQASAGETYYLTSYKVIGMWSSSRFMKLTQPITEYTAVHPWNNYRLPKRNDVPGLK